MRLETDKKVIGGIIKFHRKCKHLTQAELAEMAGLNEKQIYRIEAGLNIPTYLSFVRLVDVLDIDINEFAAGENNGNNPVKEELICMINNSREFEIKTFFDVVSAIKKNIDKINV